MLANLFNFEMLRADVTRVMNNLHTRYLDATTGHQVLQPQRANLYTAYLPQRKSTKDAKGNGTCVCCVLCCVLCVLCFVLCVVCFVLCVLSLSVNVYLMLSVIHVVISNVCSHQ